MISVGTKAQCCYKICYYAMVLLRSPSAWIRDMTHVWKFIFRCNRAQYGTITSGDSSAQTQIRSACERWIIPKEWIGLKLTNFWIFMWWIMSFRVKHIDKIPILINLQVRTFLCQTLPNRQLRLNKTSLNFAHTTYKCNNTDTFIDTYGIRPPAYDTQMPNI